jgi:hypothetical protein
MFPAGVSDYLARLGLPEGLALFILLLLLAHVVVIGTLCCRTRAKADKWKKQKRELRFRKAE